MKVFCARLLLTAAAMTLVAGCHRSSEKPSLDTARRARDPRAATASDGASPSAITGSLVVGRRPIDFGVYLASPPAPDVILRAQKAERQRFPGLTLRVGPPAAARPSALVFAPPIAELAPPSIENLRYFGRGLDESQAKAAAASKGVLVLTWALDGDPKLERLRTAQQLALEVAQGAQGFVWDDATRELYTTDRWKSARVDGWDGDWPDMRRHITIHYYETTGRRHRAITLGMAKFGLPDLVVDDTPLTESDGMTSLVDALAQLLVEGAEVGADGEVAIDVRAVRHAAVREGMMADAKAGAALRCSASLSPAVAEAGDPENRLVRLRFPSMPGATEAEQQASAVKALAGAKEDRMSAAQADDAELAAATARVQARLPAVAAAFRKGLALGERLAVKAPFDTDDGSVEWMWLEVRGWKGDVVTGSLENEPLRVSSLKLGARVQVKQASIADYLWSDANGKRKEGGESSDILMRREGATE
jgi:uncharacterized protein YegJ (DUF2314 family)